MIFNKIPCLDNGYVALLYSSNTSPQIRELKEQFKLSISADAQLLSISTMSLIMKCPLFVRMYLSQFGLTSLPLNEKDSPQELEAYIPNVGEILSGDTETDRLISADINTTTKALLINPLAYQADGCDKFTSQVITPINTYNTIIVHGTYLQWVRVLDQEGLPNSIKAYYLAIKQILEAEWPDEQV